MKKKEIFEVKFKKILHSKMKAGANLALNLQFGNSNSIGLKYQVLKSGFDDIIYAYKLPKGTKK